MVAVKAGGDFLRQASVRKHVASDLLKRELVIRLIAIEGVDDPIAPAPHVALAIVLVTIRVGVAGRIQPAEGHPLTVAWRSEQAIHYLFVHVGRRVLKE